MENTNGIDDVIKNLKEMTSLYGEIVNSLISEIERLMQDKEELRNQLEAEKETVNKLNDSINHQSAELTELKQKKQQDAKSVDDAIDLLNEIKELVSVSGLKKESASYNNYQNKSENPGENTNRCLKNAELNEIQLRQQNTPKYLD